MTVRPASVLAAPTARNRSGCTHAAILALPGGDIVLGTDGNAAQVPLEATQRSERLRKEYPVFQAGMGEAGLGNPAGQYAPANEPRVYIELACPDGESGQWIERVVLEDEQPAGRAKDAVDLAEQRHVPVVFDVVEHAGRKGEVESSIRKRQGDSIEGRELGKSRKPRCRHRQRSARDVSTGHAGGREVLAKVGYRGADPAAEVEEVEGGRAVVGRQGRRDLLHLVLREIVRRLAGKPDVAGVGGAILVGKLVELCFQHVGPHTPQTLEKPGALPACKRNTGTVSG